MISSYGNPFNIIGLLRRNPPVDLVDSVTNLHTCFKSTPMRLGCLCDCPSASEVTLAKMGKIGLSLQWRHMSVMASQITSISTVCFAVYSGAHQRKHQSSTSLAFVRELTSDQWISRTKVGNTWFKKRDTHLWPLLLTWFNFNPSMDK